MSVIGVDLCCVGHDQDVTSASVDLLGGHPPSDVALGCSGCFTLFIADSPE